MHWGQIKTLLILSFLVLDVFLFMQFLEKKEEADIGILEQHLSSIEEQLQDDNITYEKLPDEEYEETFISVKQKTFTEDELKDYTINQQLHIIQGNLIISKVNETIKIDKSATMEQLMNVFHNLVNFSDQYAFWNWNRDENIIYFFQNKLERPVYYNANGLVMVYLDENDEVSFYTQAMLGEEEQLAEKQKLMKPIQAIETLYLANELQSGDHIDHVIIGFHTRVPFEADVQVFAPIWKISVNNEKDYFINAIEGFTFSNNERNFLNEVVYSTYLRLQNLREKSNALEEVYADLEARVEENNRGE